jgi:uncharacterized protein (TIGR00369 family)
VADEITDARVRNNARRLSGAPMDLSVERWPIYLKSAELRSAATAIGVMVDESVGGVINPLCPPGRVAVTSELSIDVAWPASGRAGELRADSEVLALLPDRALARGTIRTADGAVIVSASTWCLFVDSGGGPSNSSFWSLVVPPAELVVTDLLQLNDGAAAVFTPDARCANDLGNLHGGVMLAVLQEAALTSLAGVLERPLVSSVKVNYLRPAMLNIALMLEVDVVHAGRTVAVARVVARNPDGKVAAMATVTGCRGPG